MKVYRFPIGLVLLLVLVSMGTVGANRPAGS